MRVVPAPGCPGSGTTIHADTVHGGHHWGDRDDNGLADDANLRRHGDHCGYNTKRAAIGRQTSPLGSGTSVAYRCRGATPSRRLCLKGLRERVACVQTPFAHNILETIPAQEGGVTVCKPSRFTAILLSGSFAFLLAGCAASGGDPGAASLPSGESCQSIRTRLARLDAKGVRSSVEAQSAGRKLSASQKSDADSYNQALNQYLGARCHV